MYGPRIGVRESTIQQHFVQHFPCVGHVHIALKPAVSIATRTVRLQNKPDAFAHNLRPQKLLRVLAHRGAFTANCVHELWTIQAQESHLRRFVFAILDGYLDRIAVHHTRDNCFNVGIALPVWSSCPKCPGVIQHGKRNKQEKYGNSKNGARPSHHTIFGS